MSKAPHPVATICRNCGASLLLKPVPRFCPQCGQETQLHPPSLMEFVHEFVGHYIALEGALWRTLGLLLLFPGRLTREYFAGRRRRYVLPLRLYLSASFIFFVVVKLFGFGSMNLQFAGAVDAQGRPLKVAESKALQAELADARACVASAACAWTDRQASRLRLGLAAAADSPQSVQSRLISLAPYTVFLMLPVFAAIVQLAYRRRRLNYGAHVLFSLHMHAFWFLALLAMALLPDVLAWPLALATVAYGLWALRTVYQGRWWTTLLRGALISVLYGIAFVLALVALVALAVLRG